MKRVRAADSVWHVEIEFLNVIIRDRPLTVGAAARNAGLTLSATHRRQQCDLLL
ncbi:MAG: hypothetical protein ABIN96_05250 [Rubrivivax sp.]